MSKKKKRKLAEKRRQMARAVALSRGVTLALSDDSGIEKAVRKVWNWANDQLAAAKDEAAKGSLQRLQGKMSEALDVLATVLGVALDPFPEPATGSLHRTARPGPTRDTSAFERKLLRDPLVRRGFEAAQKALRDGTWGLTDDQREIAARMGITDQAMLAKLSQAMSAKAGGVRSKASDELTPELRKVAERLGIAAVDPKKISETAEAMRSGAGVELQMNRPAA